MHRLLANRDLFARTKSLESRRLLHAGNTAGVFLHSHILAFSSINSTNERHPVVVVGRECRRHRADAFCYRCVKNQSVKIARIDKTVCPLSLIEHLRFGRLFLVSQVFKFLLSAKPKIGKPREKRVILYFDFNQNFAETFR